MVRFLMALSLMVKLIRRSRHVRQLEKSPCGEAPNISAKKPPSTAEIHTRFLGGVPEAGQKRSFLHSYLGACEDT